MADDDALTDVVARYETAFNVNDARAMNDLFAADPIFVNVAVVHVRQRPANPDGSLRPVDGQEQESVLVLVLARETDGWHIRVGQNTVVA
ncbi:hypothetical protein [Amycolatopsis nigrescens]|uniref:hypothetical protein n=1 Tax=Amycolatopsis nigrescens TaxID=381445 RepID=UPI00039B301D|nr:hypothetical protein [Amycolatopsis nigrescens]